MPRLQSVDFLKGIGIILVVLGHYPITVCPELGKWIFAFHMPLFAFIGGLFFKPESFYLFAKKKLKRLLLPFFFWSVFFWLFYFALFKFESSPLLSQHYHHLIYIIAGSGRNAAGEYANVTLWFLPFLFSVSLIHLFFDKLIVNLDNKWFEYMAVFCIALLGYFCGKYSLTLPYKFNTALTLYPFFWLGSKYLSQIPSVKTCSTMKIICFAFLFSIVYIISVYFNRGVDTASNIIGNFWLFYLGGISGIGLLCIYSEFFAQVKLINFLGRNTLVVLIFHLPVLLLLNYLIYYFNIKTNWVTDLFVPICTIFICSLLIPMLNRYLPFTIGLDSKV